MKCLRYENNLQEAQDAKINDADEHGEKNPLEEVKSEETSNVETNESEESSLSNEDQEVIVNNEETPQKQDEVIDEIEESNAKDAEDEGRKERHRIEVKEYDKMSLESLAIELEKLVKNEKVQAIKSHVNQINTEFKSKFQALLDEKKTDFLNEGGNEIDFYYSSPVQRRFKEAYRDYRNKLNEHYKNLEKNLSRT